MTEKNTTGDVEHFQFPKKEVQRDHYEIMVLVTGGELEEVQKIFDGVKKLITSFGGITTSEDPLGRRSLGYTVAGTRSGTYYVAEFDCDKSKIAELREKLRIQKEIARFLIVKKRLKTEEELVEEERIRKKIESRKAEKMKKDIAELEKDSASITAPTQLPISAERAAMQKKAEKQGMATPDAAQKEKADSATKKQPPEQPASLEDIDKEIEKLLSDDLNV